MRTFKFTRFSLIFVLFSSSNVSLGNDPRTIKLWPKEVPGETKEIAPEEAVTSPAPFSVTRISNVSVPTLTVYSPQREKSNGSCVVICPGGGYNILAYDLEGTEVARWLNSFGVTAVVLKYRVPRRDKLMPHIAPLQDTQRAIRLTRRHAKDWNINPARIGMLGFSAGGHLTVMTGTLWDSESYTQVDEADKLSSRPDFLIPIYAAYLGNKENPYELDRTLRITSDTPPTFLAVTHDDKQRGIHAALLCVALKKASVPAELHIYSKGGHGYGLRPSENPVSTWPQRCQEWMKVMGYLSREK